MIKLYNNNSLEIMKQMIANGEKVDCIITDPPYKTITGGKRTSTNKGFGVLADNDNFKFEIPNHKEWLKLAYDVLVEQAHIYVMTNHLNLEEFLTAIREAGFHLHNVLVWNKETATPNRWYYKNCEYIIFAKKGKAKTINDPKSATNFSMKWKGDSAIHPTAKPVELMEIFVNNSSNENNIILDPFMGAGSTGVAALKNNRKFIGIEINEQYFNTAKERIEGERKWKKNNTN